MEQGKSKKLPRRYVVAGAIVVLIGLIWSTHALLDWFLWGHHSHPPSTRANMHHVQLAVEDYATDHGGRFPNTSTELGPYLLDQHLQNNFTKEPLVVIVRKGPPVGEDALARRGAVVVERPDSANYVIRGCTQAGNWMEFQLRHDPALDDTR